MSTMEPARYFTDQSLAASFNGPTLDVRGMRRVSFTVEWGAVALTAGDWRIEDTDDPRAEADLMRGTSTATWVERTIPSGAIDGTNITVSGKNISITTTAGNFSLNLDVAKPYIRLKYVRGAGGAAAQAQARRSAGP